MTSLPAFFRDVGSEVYWLRLAPWLHVGGPEPARPATLAADSDPTLPADGYVRLDALLEPSAAAALARAAQALRAHAIHPTFLYVYDETWNILGGLRPWLARWLGDDFEVLADAWAFCIDPRVDSGGWAMHRGWYEDVRDGAGAPGLLNVWVSLTKATQRNACIHVVPLWRDPHFPGDLKNLSGLDPLGVPLPTAAGSALVWNANAAHWGGCCDPSYDQARISVTFTARRRGGPPEDRCAVRIPLTFRDRLDLIAEQLATYGHKELGPQSNEMRWAVMVNAMGNAARQKPY